MLTTAAFTWDARTRRFIGEMSDIPSEHYTHLTGGKTGLTIVSTRTCLQATFVESEALRDADGDLVAVVFRPTALTLLAQPKLRGVTVHLLND
jgi:hypothetical protein